MTKIKSYLYMLSAVATLYFVMALTFVSAAEIPIEPDGIQVQLQNPLRMDTLEEFLIAILDLIMVLMVPVMVFFIIFAGFKYVTARGNPTTIQEATKALTYAVIGAVIILGAVAISQMVKNTVDEFQVDTTASIYIDTSKLS